MNTLLIIALIIASPIFVGLGLFLLFSVFMLFSCLWCLGIGIVWLLITKNDKNPFLTTYPKALDNFVDKKILFWVK